jgi:hypothetical protein
VRNAKHRVAVGVLWLACTTPVGAYGSFAGRYVCGENKRPRQRAIVIVRCCVGLATTTGCQLASPGYIFTRVRRRRAKGEEIEADGGREHPTQALAVMN